MSQFSGGSSPSDGLLPAFVQRGYDVVVSTRFGATPMFIEASIGTVVVPEPPDHDVLRAGCAIGWRPCHCGTSAAASPSGPRMTRRRCR